MKTRITSSILIGALAALTLSGAVLAQDDSADSFDSPDFSDGPAASYFVFKLGSEFNLEARDTPQCAGAQAAREQASASENSSRNGAAFVITHGFVLPEGGTGAPDRIDAFAQDNDFTPQGEWHPANATASSRTFTSSTAPGYDYVVDVYPQGEQAGTPSSALCVTVLRDREER